MSDVIDILIGILGLALLMVVHEGGHLLAARAFGMRVITFSIGFGPTFFKIEPQDGYFWFTSFNGKVRLRLGKHDEDKHGPTVYQVAMIPFLAYVQIAGMNPFEDEDPEDEGSYANASLAGRITTIFGGPLANYLFASVLFFFAFYYGGTIAADDHPGTTQVEVMDDIDARREAGDSEARDRPAKASGMKSGDRIVSVDGADVDTWRAMAGIISKQPGKPLDFVVDREGERVPLTITPDDVKGRGLIGVHMRVVPIPVTAREAAWLAVEKPPIVVKNLVVGLGSWITGAVDAELGGPVMIVKESARAMKRGMTEWLKLLGALSAYLGAFNLIPFPALDGGRLMFLGYELATRRRPQARLEAHIHFVGLVLLLGLMLYVTIFNDFKLGGH
jgi:regulator of sigma E protease